VDLAVALAAVRDRLGALATSVEEEGGAVVVRCAVAGLAEVMQLLRSGTHCFSYFSFMTAVDYPPAEPREGQEVQPGRLDLVYHVANVDENLKVFVTTSVGRPAAKGTPPRAPSICGIYSGANWHERECCEMFGVDFEGHPDLRHLLLPDDWVGHPLLKDDDPSRNDLQYTPEKCWPEMADRR